MGKRILILDDDSDLLFILDELLVMEGFHPIVVESTYDLLKLVRHYQPDLILLDFALNGIDGGTWCATLKSTADVAHIPVIIFSAYSSKNLEKGAHGCDDFIAKPFDVDDLINRIRLLTTKTYYPPVIASRSPRASA